MKPRLKLEGQDGNIFFILGAARSVLKKLGLRNEAEEMSQRVMSCESYNEALKIISDYVDWE